MNDVIKIEVCNEFMKSPLKTAKGTLEVYSSENLYLIPANWGGKNAIAHTGLKVNNLPEDVYVGVEPVEDLKGKLSFLPSWEDGELVVSILNTTDRTILIMPDNVLGVLKCYKVVDIEVKTEDINNEKPKRTRTKNNTEVK